MLVVVTLTTLAAGTGIAPAELVGRIQAALLGSGAEVADTFRKRLDASGYLADPAYAAPMFRLDGLDFFAVEGDFPRIRRAGVSAGIERVVYDLLLGSCSAYRTVLRR